MRILIKKSIAVGTGYFESLWIHYVIFDPILLSLILMVNFVLFYAALDFMFFQYETNIEKIPINYEENKKKILVKKFASVGSGYFESLPIIFLVTNPLMLSLVLMVNFIFFYAGMDKVFLYFETRLFSQRQVSIQVPIPITHMSNTTTEVTAEAG